MSDDERPPDADPPDAARGGFDAQHGYYAPWERTWAVARTARPGDERSVAALLRKVGVPETSRRRTPASAPRRTPIPAAPITEIRPSRLQAKRARRRRRATVIRRTTAALTALLVFLVTGAAWAATEYLDSKINQVDALDENSGSVQNAPAQRGDENYLLVGSDSRAGSNGEIGAGTTADAAGARSDTVMLAHVPADRGRVVVVSFPRDLEVDRPACAEWNNADATYSTEIAPAETQSKLNVAYAIGGPKCLVQVIQQLSGLKINHFVGVDFAGFEALVDQIGGVEVCTTRPLVDNQLGTILPDAGTQVIDGKTALNYVRARKVPAEGNGDYGRIKRQQLFLSSLLRKAMSTDVLFSFRKLSGFINGFTAATFGQNMGSDSLITLGRSLQGLSAGRVTFITVPTTGTRYGNEIPDLGEISKIFAAIIDDTPLPGESGPGAAPSSTTPTTTPAPATPTKPGGSAEIEVLNATNQSGVAGRTRDKLADFGYTMSEVGTARALVESTTIRYSASQADAAAQLGASIPRAVLIEAPDLGQTITLTLGQDYSGDVVAPTDAPPTDPSLPDDLSIVNAGDDICG